jgi:pantothenate kinase
VFLVVDSQITNRNHFLKVSKDQWRVLESFSNGDIEVSLLGWVNNTVSLAHNQMITTTAQRTAVQGYGEAKAQLLQ